MKDKSRDPQPYDDKNDAAEIAAIANGDREAFQRLHQRYRGLLFVAINRVLQSQQDSEEVLQEVFFSLWKKAHQFHSGKGRPITWLSSMARNRAIDRVRSRQRHNRIRDAVGEEQTDQMRHSQAHVAGNGIKIAIRRDICATVQDALAGLTPVQREAIELCYFQGLTQAEAATKLGEPIGTIKARVRRALEKLRKTETIQREGLN